VIDGVAGKRGAERSADAHRAVDNAEPEIEASGAARDVGDDQRQHHAENGRADAIEDLHGDDQIGIGHKGKQHAAHSQGREAEQQ